jgi:hypothetical protein
MDYQPGLKAILDNSGTLANWALAVMGGSVAALVSTSYERPKTRSVRLMYFLFPLAWVFLVSSVHFGQKLSGRFIAAQLSPAPDNVRRILIAMNNDFLRQYHWLIAGLITVFLWLFCFLVWWVFYATKDSDKKRPVTRPGRVADGN